MASGEAGVLGQNVKGNLVKLEHIGDEDYVITRCHQGEEKNVRAIQVNREHAPL